jgi:hypothetical protein
LGGCGGGAQVYIFSGVHLNGALAFVVGGVDNQAGAERKQTEDGVQRGMHGRAVLSLQISKNIGNSSFYYPGG